MTEAMTDLATLPFDTLAAHKNLTAAGMPDDQADAVVKIQAGLLTGSLATRADLKELQNATRADLKELQNATRADLKELQNDTEARFKELQNATRADLKELQNVAEARFDATDARFEQLRADLEKKIATTGVDMLKWTVGFQIGIALIIVAVLKLF